MANPYRDAQGQYCSRDEMQGAMTHAREEQDFATLHTLQRIWDRAESIRTLRQGVKRASTSIYARAQHAKARENLAATDFPGDISELSADERLKIGNWAERYGIPYETALAQIVAQPMAYVAIVGKAYSRQNIYEVAFRDFLAAKHPAAQVEKLPNGGVNSVALIDGKIVRNPEVTREVKTLDFLVTLPSGKRVYVIHKYAADEGGHQKNQYNDAGAALAQMRPGADFQVAAILDGDYFARPTGRKKEGPSLREQLRKRHSHTEGVYVGDYRSFSAWLAKPKR